MTAPVRDVSLDDCLAAARLVEAWKDAGGFTASKVATSARILADAWDDAGCGLVLSMPAAPIATGLRGVVRGLVQRGLVQALVTTCGTLDHDIARTVAHYEQGSFGLDDREVAKRGYHRLGSVLVPEDAYGPLIETFCRPVLEALHKESPRIAGCALARRLGESLALTGRGGESLLAACARRDVPVFVPGMTDGSVGAQIWSFAETHRDTQLDLIADERALNAFVHTHERLAALIVGGGISKHHTIWWAQFRGGLDRAVYITTAPEHDGSLSGARMREAVSWGKLKADAAHETVEGDATVVLPLVVGAALTWSPRAQATANLA